MAQQFSFDLSGPQTLIDNPAGRVVYTADFVDPHLTETWFEGLLHTIDWKGSRRRMYDRDVDVPRLTASFRLDAAALPLSLKHASALVEHASGVSFNTVGLNLYRDGNDSVAPHNDTLDDLVAGFPIALLSLGTVRTMTIRTKRSPYRSTHLELQPGSLLMMDWRSQLNYDHGIPKERGVRGSRISLAFRVSKLD